MPTVLILDSDEQVIQDVTCSLELIGARSAVARSFLEAKQKLLELNPELVLARAQFQGEPDMVLRFAGELAGHEELGKIPIVLLLDQGAEAPETGGVSTIVGNVALPVEFPAFSHRIQDMLGHQVIRSQRDHLAGADGARREGSSHSVTIGRRQLLAYGIQLEVSRRLQSNERFLTCSIDELPRIVAEETRAVCEHVKIEELTRE